MNGDTHGMNRLDYDNLRKCLAGLAGSNVLIVTHRNPDGDAIGSSLALLRLLKNLGAKAQLLLPEVPERLGFLVTESDNVVEKAEAADVIIGIDMADKNLSDLDKSVWEQSPKTINIDHHGSNTQWGDLRFIDPFASAAAEMVWLTCMENQKVKDIAEPCYMGMRTDTGGFSFPNTTDRTMQCVSECLGAGADTTTICERLSEHSKAALELLGWALANTIYSKSGSVALVMMDRSELDWLSNPKPRLQEALSMLRSIPQVLCAVSCYRDLDGTWKGSLRTARGIDASKITARWSGGGHPGAAGFRLPKDYDPMALVDILEAQAQTRND